jgi:hypothetical protein
MKPILVVMEGGVIQDVVGVPEGYELVVRDYDVEGCDLEAYLANGELYVGPSGALCTQVVWGSTSPTEDDGTRPATRADIEED